MPAGGLRAWAARLLAAVLSAASVACSNPSDVGASELEPGVEGLIDWVVAHPEDVGLVVLVDGERKLAHQPDQHFPLASTIKVLTLVAYAEQVAAGVLDETATVPVEAVDRLYLAGTDGGAHEAARSEWGDAAHVTLEQLTRAMIRYSSNAAADVMLEQVGGPSAVVKVARRHKMTRQHPPVAVFELFRSWEGSREPVRALAAATPAGTPGEWASLMEQLRTGDGLTLPAADIVRKHLEWPLTFGENRRLFHRFGTKGGALPGLITEASYLVKRDDRATSVSLFLRELPDDAHAQLLRSYTHQELIRALAEQPDVLADLASRLGRR